MFGFFNRKKVPKLDASIKVKEKKKAEASEHTNSKRLCKQKHSKIQQQLEEKVDKVGGSEQYEVIVHLNCDKKEIPKLKKVLGKSFKLHKEFKYINAFTCRLTAKQIKQLIQHHDIDFIEENSRIHMNLDTANRWSG
ncbi:hypothetical protein ACFFHM_15115 [Halalkalibacter kiskunsagensis]|uniref:Inhibitor I9 domain-containing protein n=1 Tax=Halalkalibacter kiskunsagensis TaxID=1548599 RepID=A0ABV6KEP2_9BACI